MTDHNDDELMPLEDALRILMKVPPQEPCDEQPTADGDDQVEADEEGGQQ
jgi:hypothetical protein